MPANDNQGMKLSESLHILDECVTDWQYRFDTLKEIGQLTFRERKHIKEKLVHLECMRNELIEEYY